ncbi:MAG TPA: FAD-dependent oxidoreductase [Opitutus sp.]|nr:FAD-dependent oxidoreductase [Opitutus sp.]
MNADILIVGQGLAGTMLGWELERAGVKFRLVDAGHARAASRVATGIINPITGRRIVRSWRADTLLPIARESYLALEAELRVPLWQDLRVRRLYVDEEERRMLAEEQARDALSDYARVTDSDGFWIEGAARVDVPALIAAARERWRRGGLLQEERVDVVTARNEHDLVIDCRGAIDGAFGFVRWQYSKGECLTIAIEGLAPNVAFNRGHWMMPLSGGLARVGATHAPSRRDTVLTAEARAALEASVRTMSDRKFAVVDQDAGVRVYVADKKPVAGRHPADARLGVFSGLGGKGALFAPAIARMWAEHLVHGTPFDREVDVARMWRG